MISMVSFSFAGARLETDINKNSLPKSESFIFSVRSRQSVVSLLFDTN